MIGNRAGPSIPGRMTVTFSSSFAAQNLPTPAMRLLDDGAATPVVEDSPLAVVPGATLKISADDLIAQARSLHQVKATAQNLAATNEHPVAALAASPPAPPTGSAASAASRVLIAPAELFKLRNAQVATTANLKRGDDEAAAMTSNHLAHVIAGEPVYAVSATQN